MIESGTGWDCTQITIEPLWGGEPINPAEIRGIPLARLLRRGRSLIFSRRLLERKLLADAQLAEGVPQDEVDWPSLLKSGRFGRRGAPALSPEHLMKVAASYNAAEGDTAPGRKRPVLAVMAEFDLPRSTAVKQIRRCREAGFIGPAPNRGVLMRSKR